MSNGRYIKPQGELRQSQVVMTFGPGSMVDLPKHSVLIAGLDYWSEVEIHYHLNVAALSEAIPGSRFLYFTTKAERALIEETLQQVRWNRRRAAEQLGVSYKTLLNKIKECGISRK